MNYVFHVRDWNIDFYLNLENTLIEKDKNVEIVWLTMLKAAFNHLHTLNKKVYYLPDLFETNSEKANENIQILDGFILKNYNYGIEFLYEIERFKPAVKFKTKFINGHINALMKIIPENSKLISLTCDHFVYIISAYINEFKGGTNYFIQPIGFPQNAQVIMHNPWDLNYFRKGPLKSDKPLTQYIQSLELDPKVSIHYMKPQKLISLKHSLFKRLKDLTLNKTSKSIFTYLEPRTNNLIPSRFRQKKKINYVFNYLLESDIKKAAEESNLFYYPLQFEPEMSILAYSPWYKNQLEIIRLISQSLKSGDLLLLKENPKMIGKRNNDFYNYIETFGNIRWAHPEINSRLIIRYSFKVISITGTATIEAACLGINSLIFGHPPFRNLLLEKPVAEQPLNRFTDILYKYYKKEEIIENVRLKWPEFSKSLFYGNFIPTYVNNKLTVNDSKQLAKQFFNEVLSL